MFLLEHEGHLANLILEHGRVKMKQMSLTLFASLCLLCGQASAAEPEQSRQPFYADKTNLLVWIDDAGQTHPITEPGDWLRRREHILANMSLVMGPLPKHDGTPLDVREQGEEIRSSTRAMIRNLTATLDQLKIRVSGVGSVGAAEVAKTEIATSEEVKQQN